LDLAVSPRAGGEADKFGNRYEGMWTVSRLLEVIAGRALSIQVERGAEPDEGVEFFLRRPACTEAHQVKRQHGRMRGWTPRSLEQAGVLQAAAKHVADGLEFHFVSTIPATDVRELAERARGSDDAADFWERSLTAADRVNVEYLARDEVWGSVERVWATLRRVQTSVADERNLLSMNAALCELLFEPADGAATATALGDLVLGNLGRTLDADAIWQQVERYGLRRAPMADKNSLSEVVGAGTRAWRREVGHELLEPVIPRAQVEDIEAQLAGSPPAQVLVTGAAGGGKTAVLAQSVDAIASRGWPILVVRADRLAGVNTTSQIGTRFDLPASPVTSLATLADGASCLLVVDQLDALSIVSGRAPELLSTVVEMLRESAAFPNLRVVMACRQYDLDNDERLRRLVEPAGAAHVIPVTPLSEAEVDAAVAAAGLPARRLNAKQRELLRVPLHLVLLRGAASGPTPLDFASPTDLFDAFWVEKRRAVERRREPSVRFAPLVIHLARRMSEEQRLSLPRGVLAAGDFERDAEVLASEHVLSLTPNQVGFFHESFFDYAFAVHWTAESAELVPFLLAGDQELFRRAQVRQILLRLHDQDPARFTREAEALLTHPLIRFHVKDAALAVLRSLRHPSQDDYRMMRRLVEANLPFSDRVEAAMRTAGWFARLDAEGEIQRWLADQSGSRHGLALELMGAAARDDPARMAELLSVHRDRPDYDTWLRWIARYANLADDRALFDLVIEGVTRGAWDGNEAHLWLCAHGLGRANPEWACELLEAFFARRPRALTKDGDKLIDLQSREHGLITLIAEAAEGKPARFINLMVPYMLRAMAVAHDETHGAQFEDAHFSHRIYNNRHITETDDALLAGAVAALRTCAQADAKDLKPTLDLLAGDPHDAAQWLLYEALRAAAPTYADWAADLLLEGPHRLRSGYTCHSYWTTRQLLLAIAGDISDQRHTLLEQAILALRLEWGGHPGGQMQFALLSALDRKRLTAAGKRRLGELERLFGEPYEPMGMVVSGVPSPIPEPATRKMTDAQWLRAMRKHAVSDRRGRELFDGGADELANELQARTKEDPSRYARLALELDGTYNPRFLQAVLLGLGETDKPYPPDDAYALLRHAAQVGVTQIERWLTRPLYKLLDAEIPDDIIELVLDIAEHNASPAPDEPSAIVSVSNDDPENPIDNLLTNGMNTVRGSAALTLGDIVLRDADGARTALVVPRLPRLAADPHPAVRACIAHLVAACLRHARSEAVAVVPALLANQQHLLAEQPVVDLLSFLIYGGELDEAEPALTRMLTSNTPRVAEAGGRLAALAALEAGRSDLIAIATTTSPATRRGAAAVSARRLPFTANAELAERIIRESLADPDEPVRNAAAEIAPALRGQPLAPYTGLLLALIDSDALDHALPQLLITLERAPDRIEELVLPLSDRFIKEHAQDLKSIATSYAGDAKQVTELLLRAYSQTDERQPRLEALRMLDQLLLLGAWGAVDAISESER
jgi:hypothetical protein